MSDCSQQQLGNTLWAIADQLRGAMNAYNFPDSWGLVDNHQGEIKP
jgi:type I restriction-modification system DNA methylase subunit